MSQLKLHRTLVATLLALGCVAPASAVEVLSGPAGLNQPFDNTQPSLAITMFMTQTGVFPPRDGEGATPNVLGSVRMFAGNFAPGGGHLANGTLLPIAPNTALFSILGTNYGGDGRTTFAVPDLAGRTPIQASVASMPGETSGVRQQTLGQPHIAIHSHSLPGSALRSGPAGGLTPFDNRQPALGLNYVIAGHGVYPSPSAGFPGAQPLTGRVSLFAGSFAPGGYLSAEGQLLPISAYEELFSLIGTTYGGDGMTTFALPDLRGRTVIGTGAGPGLTLRQLGDTAGQAETFLSAAQLVAHDHGLPGSIDRTGFSGNGAPINNMQPSLALTYMIATVGIFPPRECCSGTDETLLGEIGLFAFGFAPGGWTIADGRLLSISSNTALFSILGTTYGGDGRVTFALPDLRGRSAVGTGGEWELGETAGQESFSLGIAQLASHAHAVPVPEPHSYVLMLVALAVLGVYSTQRRSALRWSASRSASHGEEARAA